MIRLSLHRSHAAIHEEEPVVHFEELAATGWEADLVVRIIPVDEVLHYRAALEQSDELTILELVGQGWNSTIWIDLEKPRLLLGVLRDIDLLNLVW